MATDPHVEYLIEHGRDMVRSNIQRLGHSALRLEFARQRMVEAVERLRQSVRLLEKRTIYDDVPSRSSR